MILHIYIDVLLVCVDMCWFDNDDIWIKILSLTKDLHSHYLYLLLCDSCFSNIKLKDTVKIPTGKFSLKALYNSLK